MMRNENRFDQKQAFSLMPWVGVCTGYPVVACDAANVLEVAEGVGGVLTSVPRVSQFDSLLIRYLADHFACIGNEMANSVTKPFQASANTFSFAPMEVSSISPSCCRCHGRVCGLLKKWLSDGSS